MNIRAAVTTDKPAIIELLRSSLGESTIPKSEGLWAWKHEQNPFGNSYVLVAEENNMLIGLRAFMQWQWRWNDSIFKTIRAVDTATHPDHQGKGIFKKLTLEQLDRCRTDDVRFVFNTPNSQSMPGYLKMGWQIQGRIPLKLQALNPMATVSRLVMKNKAASFISPKSDWPALMSAFANREPFAPAGLHTPYSTAYVQWRYAENPLFPYSFITDNKNYFLVYRIKEHSRVSELRITDLFVFNNSGTIRHDIRKKLRVIARESGADLLAISGRQWIAFRKYLPSFGLIPVRNSGPTVTLRKVTAGDEFDTFMNVSNWSYSLGDLELF
jgi:GNAT superfamily N-acetyltransferase